MDFTETLIIPLALVASESIAHEVDIDSEPIRAQGIIVEYMYSHCIYKRRNKITDKRKKGKKEILIDFDRSVRWSEELKQSFILYVVSRIHLYCFFNTVAPGTLGFALVDN